MSTNKADDEIDNEILDVENKIFKVIEEKSFAISITAMGFVLNKVIRKHVPKNHWGFACEEFCKILKASINTADSESNAIH